jgi:hypothetical protein
MAQMNQKNDNEKKVIDGNYRAFTPGSYKEEKDTNGNITQRCIRATFATDNPVDVYDWQSDDIIREVLRMDGMQIPAIKQVPLLDNHSRWEGSASVRGSCRNMEDMKNGTAEADVYFSSLANTEATLAREGHLTDLSVGYKTFADKTTWIEPGQRATVNNKEYDNSDSKMRMAIRTTWNPFEISTTPIGADARTKFRDQLSNNQQREVKMSNEKTTPETAPEKKPDTDNAELRSAIAKEAGEAELQRVLEIQETCRTLNIELDFAKEMIKGRMSAVEANRKITEEAQKRLKPAPQGAPNIGVGADEVDKFREIAATGLLLRSGYPVNKIDPELKKAAEKSEFRGSSIQHLARHCLEKAGMRGVMYMDNKQVADAILDLSCRASVAQGSADFPYITAAAANKFLMLRYTEQATTWQKWCGTQPLNDFKQNKLVNISLFSDIDLVPEGENFKWGRQSDKVEYITLYKYGKAYNLSYEAIVNDDKNAFSQVPGNIGGACARKKERAVYNYLYRGNTEGTGSGAVGPTMNEDSKAMFHSDHGNLLSTLAPSVTSLTAAQLALRTIKLPAPDPTSKTQYTNAPIKYIITTVAKWGLWSQILGSESTWDAATNGAINTQANPNVINPFKNAGIELITTPFLDEFSSTVWYAAADPNQVQHIIMATMAGEEAPQLRSAPNEIGMAKGISWEVMNIFAVGSPDWRGIAKNVGA